MPRIKVGLSLEQELWRRLKGSCALLGKEPSTEVEELMRHWLAVHEPEAVAHMEDRHHGQGTTRAQRGASRVTTEA
jgi:hypothetical protein